MANHKLALFVASAVSFAINLMLIVMLAIDGISFLYIMFPMLMCILSVAFIVLSAFTNFRCSYSLWYTIMYSLLFAVTAVMFGLVLMGFGKESAMTYFAIGLWALVNLLNLIAIISGSVRAGSFKKGARATVAIIILLVSIAGYTYFVTSLGFFGQGAETSDRPVTFVYDEEEKFYVATGTLTGKGKVVTVPETFNGIKVGAIDCSIFSTENVHTVVLNCASDVEFRSPELLASIPEGLSVQASRETLNGMTSTVYEMAVTGNTEAVLAFAQTFAPSDLADNEVYVTFTYTEESVKAAEGNFMPIWIGTAGSALSFDDAFPSYVDDFADRFDESNLAAIFNSDAHNGGYVVSDIKDAKGNSVVGNKVTESLDNVLITFEKVYRIEVKADNDDFYELEDDFRFLNDENAYRFVTPSTAGDLLAEADPRSGFSLAWTYALGQSNEQTALTDLAAVVAAEAEENLSITPTWTMLPPTITSCTTDGLANTFTYGDEISFSSAATAPAAGLNVRYEWFKDGASIHTTSSFDVTDVKMTEAGEYTVVVTSYSDTLTSLYSTSEQKLTLTVNKKELPITWHGISAGEKPFERTYESADFAITVNFDEAAEVYEDDIEGDFSNYYTLTEPTIRNAGEHNVRITLNADLASKYYISSASESQLYTVNQKEVSIQWNVGSYTYSSNPQSPTVNIIDGVFAADESLVSVVPTTFVPAGTHTSTASLTGELSANYKIIDNTEGVNTAVSQSFTIAPYSLSFNWDINTEQVYTSTALNPEATPVFIPENDDLAALGLSYTTATVVGTHTIEVSTSNPNYVITEANKSFAGFVITPAEITLTFNNITQTYNGTGLKPLVSHSALKGNDKTADLGLVVTTQINAGSYTDGSTGMIEVSLTALNEKGNTNYRIVAVADSDDYYVDASHVAYFTEFVIVPKTVTVNWSYNNTVYNGSAQKPEPSLVATEICKRDDVPDTVIVTATVNGGDASAVNVDGYDAVAALSGEHSANYVIKEANVTQHFVINQAPLHLTWSFDSTVYNGVAQMPAPTIVTSDVFSQNGIKDDVSVTASVTGGDAVVVRNGGYVAVAELYGERQSNYYIINDNKSHAFNITAAPLTLTFSNIAPVYNGKNQAPTVTVEGLKNYETVQDVLNMTIGEKRNVSETGAIKVTIQNTNYMLVVDDADAPSYSITADKQTANFNNFKIQKLGISVIWTTGEIFTYNKKMQHPGAGIDDNVYSNDVDAGKLSLVIAGNTNAGTGYTATASLSGQYAGNYTLGNTVSDEYEISPKTITLTWNTTNITPYKNAEQKPTVSFVSGSIISGDVVSVGCNAVLGDETISAINAGEYTARAVLTGASAANYLINSEYLEIGFTIPKRTVTLRWEDTALTYNGNAQMPHPVINSTVYDSGFDGDSLSVTVDGYDGSYSATPYVARASLPEAMSSNYEIDPATGSTSFTVGKKTVYLKWTLPVGDSLVYDGQNKTVMVSCEHSSGIVGEDDVLIGFNSDLSAISAGKYTYTATLSGGDSSNYKLSTDGTNGASRTITVSPRTLSVVWDENHDRVYTAEKITRPTFTLQNTIDGDDLGESVKYISGNVNETSVATYVFEATVSNKNYTVDSTKRTTFKVTPATVTDITFNTLTYNGSMQTPTVESVEGLLGSDTVGRLSLTFTNKQTDVSDSSITVTIGNANYAFEGGAKSKTFNDKPYITKKDVTVTLTNPADLIYDGNSKSPLVSVSGLVSSDGTSYSLTITSGSDTNGKAVNAGSYTFELKFNGENASNYEIVGATVIDMEIEKRDLSISWTTPDLEYDGSSKIFTANAQDEKMTVNLPLVYFKGVSVIGNPTDAGEYRVQVNYENDNFNISGEFERAFTITKRAVTLGWSNTTQTYNGASLKPSAYFSSGKVSGDDLVASITVDGNASGQISADTYDAAAVLTGADKDNYYIANDTDKAGFTIAKAPITLGWSNLTVTYTGQPQRPSVSIYYGKVSGDDVSVSVSVDGSTQGQTDAGEYTATATLYGEDKDNYYIDGDLSRTFTINKQSVYAKWSTFSDAVDFTYSGSSKGPNVSEVYSNNPSIRFTGDEFTVTYYKDNGSGWVQISGRPSEVGSYKVVVALSSEYAKNYVIPYDTERTFNINPAESN